MDLAQLSAIEAAELIKGGKISAEELVQACLDRIQELESTVGAWAYLDTDHAIEQARDADVARQQGKACGALHGIPVGVKDIFDTEDMPTEDGTVLHAGRQPMTNATVVALLRQAGAVIMGKTVTTELAVYAPGKTRNPRDPERTPGGSSSGSAAAVAAHMLPLAVGSQTNGSVIRPASYCGVYGYKPTHGLISRYGVLHQSWHLDQVGVFARTVEDAALIAEVLMAFDQADPAMRPRARPALSQTAAQEPPLAPELAFVKTPVWDQAEQDTQDAFAELVKFLGERVQSVELPQQFDHGVTWHRTIMEADLARSFAREYEEGGDKLSATLKDMIERGRKHLAIEYNHAVEQITALNDSLDELLEEFDVIITPAASGEAPVGLESTGNPVFCTIWTLCGVPAITLPLLQGSNGMPIGVQMVAPKGDDARLLRTARWFADLVKNTG